MAQINGGIDTYLITLKKSNHWDSLVHLQDTHVIHVPFMGDPNAGFFAIYDGHGGKDAADIASLELHTYLEAEIASGANESVRESFFKAYQRMDSRLKFDALYMGATAVTCLIKIESTKKILYAANAGDARAVLCRGGKAVRLTYDHKASDATEQERVQACGGWVSMNRVHGVLAVSRALGDHAMKQSVISEPHYWEEELTGADEFVIIACDGLWDVCTDQEAVDLVQAEPDAQVMSQRLMQSALDNGGKDNISVMVIRWA
jgi:protein phosphatase PTC1